MIAESLLEKRDRVLKFFGKKPYLSLAICILFSSVLLYWQYIFGDKTYVFSADIAIDTYHGYIPVYNFFASAIKNGELSSYTFQAGYGNSLFSMIGTVADPFSMIGILAGVIFGEQYIADSMIYILILKHICAGLLCLYFLRGFNFTEKSSMPTAYIYAFSSYMITLGNHYFFAVRPIYFVLLLIMLEKNIKGKHKIRNWIGITGTVALIVLAGVTCAYEILFAAGFYTLFRVIYIYGKDVKKIMQRLGICLAFVICGFCISSFVFFPSADKITGSSRLVQSANIFSFHNPDVIKTGVLRLFSNNLEGTFNTYYGAGTYYTNIFPYFFSVMLVPMTAQFIWRTFKDKLSVKQRVFRLIPVAIVVFAIVDSFIPLFSSFFVPHYHSYIYVFLPLFAVLFADVLDNLKLGKFSRWVNYLTMVVSLAVIAWGGITTYYNGGIPAYSRGSNTSLMWMLFPAVMLVSGCFAIDIVFLSSNQTVNSVTQNQVSKTSRNNIAKTASVAFAVIIALNLFGENYITVNYERFSVTKETAHAPMITSDIINNINDLEKDNFFRFETNYYEGRMAGHTYPFLFPIRATAYYDSAIDNKVPVFYSKMFGSKSRVACDYSDYSTKVNNTITEDVLGIKYLLRTSEFQRNGWEKVEEYPDKGIYLYKNLGLNSAGLLFDSYTTQEEADSMSFYDRYFGMGKRLILDAPSENIDNYAAKISSQVPVYYDNLALYAASSSAYMGNITSVDLRDNKYYLSALNSDDGTPMNVVTPLNTNIISDNAKITQVTYALKSSDVHFVYLDANNAWNEIAPYSEKKGDEIIYTFVVPQTATHIAICENTPTDLAFSIFSETATSSYVNEGIHLDNPNRGNVISGTVEARKNSLLYIPVPYNKYWNAYVDGEKVDIMRANYAFIAITVPEGEHKVEFIYSNKAYHFGLKLSLTTITLLTIFFIVYYFVNKRKEGRK